MVWPLRVAKGSYATGNYLATIALCGTVMEMITILSFQLNAVRGRPEYWTEERQLRLFGRTFERLGQEQRVKVLRGLDIIDDELVEIFDLVREKRRKHLHFYESLPDAPDDARQCYLATVEAMVEMLGPKTVGDHATFNPKLLDYLEEQGIVVPIDPGAGRE